MIEIHGTIPWGTMTFGITTIAADSEGGVEIEGYRLVDAAHFKGGDANQTTGWLHGQKVVVDGRQFVLEGPVAVFNSDPVRPPARLRGFPLGRPA